ncbi:MAG: NAD(P)/FAD-dependent oxidoreductase [Candidatus Schekmanbacteria bacterium]|nr:MAG: NAD(P)/FAD-dependent oxidoreductase [Candidatus Schekmanbacteria bacterium]
MDADLIIIGGGPAGLMAAKTAAEEGLKVIIVDKKKDIPLYTKPCCSMLLLEPNYHDENLKTDNGKITFLKTGFSVDYDGEYVDLLGSMRFSPSLHPFTIKANPYPAAKVIDKETLAKKLFSQIDSAGVDIRPSTQGIIAEEAKDSVSVKVRDKNGEKDLTAKFAFVADGVSSNVVNRMGLNKERKFYAKGLALSFMLEGVNFPYPDAFVAFIGKRFTSAGQFYMVPKKMKKFGKDNKVWELTFGVPTGMDINPKEQLLKFKNEGPVKEWLADAKILEEIGCAMSFYSPIENPANGRIVILGDAASFQEVENQGALMCGYVASKLVKEFLEGKRDSLDEYNEFWKRCFEFNHPGVVEATARTYAIHTFTDEQLDYLFSLEENFTTPGWINHCTCADVIFAAFSKHYEEIKKHDAELAEKIKKYSSIAVDAALNT